MNRIHHTYDRWECYPGGMYETTPPGKLTAREANEAYGVFLRDVPLFERELERLLAEWPNSCEHYLSNEKMNRIAWLGQAAVCIHCRIPRGFRGGFNLLSPEEQRAANDGMAGVDQWPRPQGMVPTIDLHHQVCNRMIEVCDVSKERD